MRTHNYSLRIVKRVNSQNAVMVINLSAEYVRSAMQALDPGKGGYVALVCMDGNEFFSDNTVELDEPLMEQISIREQWTAKKRPAMRWLP